MKYGQILATAGVAADMEQNQQFRREVAEAFERYQRRDWGILWREDWELNDQSLVDGSWILAAYDTCCGRIWIITEAEDDAGNRAATTILYPEEY